MQLAMCCGERSFAACGDQLVGSDNTRKECLIKRTRTECPEEKIVYVKWSFVVFGQVYLKGSESHFDKVQPSAITQGETEYATFYHFRGLSSHILIQVIWMYSDSWRQNAPVAALRLDL